MDSQRIAAKATALLGLFLFFFLLTPLKAQKIADELGFTALKAGQYETARELMEAGLNRKKDQSAAKYGLANLLITPDYPGFDPPQAARYANEAYADYRGLSNGQRSRLQAVNVNYNSLKKLQADIGDVAIRWAEEENSPEAYQAVMKMRIPREDKMKIAPKISQAAFYQAKGTGTYSAYQQLLQSYGSKLKTEHPGLYKQASDSLFIAFVREKGKTEIANFQRLHPGHPMAQHPGLPALARALQSGEMADYEAVYEKYGEGQLLGKIAADSLAARGLSWGRRKVLRAGSGPQALQELRELIAPQLALQDWKGALEEMAYFESRLGKQPDFQALKALIAAPGQGIVRKPLDGINSVQGLEYTPVLTADGRKLYFTAQNRPENAGGEDVFVASRASVSSPWTKVELIENLSQVGRNESPLSLSADGTQMLLFLSGKISTSDKTVTGWGEPVNMGPNINAGRWQADAVLSADGKALIFVAGPGPAWDMDQNIFVALKLPDGSWGRPQSLGRTINTPASERSPFLHPDGKTLYFSSGGHGGLGGLDVFKSVRTGQSWTQWSEPVNLGKEINTPGNDWGYVISTDGKTAYFSAMAQEDLNLFELSLPEAVRPDPVTTIKGRVKGLSTETSAKLLVRDELTRKEIGQFRTEPGTGKYFIVVPGGVRPLVSVERDGVFSAPKLFDTTAKNELGEIEQDLEVVDFDNKKTKGDELSIALEDVLFETGRYAIGPVFYDDLDRLAELIKTRELSVRIEGHTDNVGDKASNQQLSEDRARAVRQYLILKGCEPQRITVRGLGETQPRATNETPEGRSQNRRVELFFRKGG